MLINDEVSLSDQQKTLEIYNHEVNKTLIDLGIDVKTMTDFLPLEFPFKFPPPTVIEQVGTSDPWILNMIEPFTELSATA